jgi:hypothetical protein
MQSFQSIPYSHLSTDPLPVTLCEGLVHATLRLESPGSTQCILSLPGHLYFDGDRRNASAPLSVGASFQVEYRDRVTEVRIGRPFTFWDN